MFIATERTPNPATLKFLPGQTVMEQGTQNFADKDAADMSPLATALFELENVSGVFFGADFISVTQDGDDWARLKPMVLGLIMDHFTSNIPLFHPTAKVASEETAEDDDEIVVQIKELLDTKVRPAVAQDGGDIVFHGFEEGIVYLHMQGACAGCPSSTMTLKSGIENLLRYYVPEVSEVRAV